MWRSLIFSSALLLFFVFTSAEDAIEIPKDQTQETLKIKKKLATAEGRVTELISRLDSVSDDASRAKTDIHKTLQEVWAVVDLLGRDQCGAVVDKVRVAQKKAESRVTELEEEVRDHVKDLEKLKTSSSKQADSISSLQADLKAERARRQGIEREAAELRDRLEWASAVSNETNKYELVAERLATLLKTVTDRSATLEQAKTLLEQHHKGFDGWQKEIRDLSGVVRKAERDFTGGYSGAAADALRTQIADLDARLREAASQREAASRERDTLRKTVENIQGRSIGGSNGRREHVVVRPSGAPSSWIGWIGFGVVSFCTGALGIYLSGLWTREDPGRPEGVVDPQAEGAPAGTGKFGFSPSSAQGSRTSPGGQGMPSMSPLTYVNGAGSANRTPASRNSTPRRY